MSFDCLFSNGSSFFSNRSKAVGFSYRSSFFNGNNFFGCNFFGRSSALLPQDAKETATITAKNNTNFFIFFCFKTINRSSLKSRQN